MEFFSLFVMIHVDFSQTYDVKRGPLETTPTFGLPSRDTHFLRDDEVSVDKPLETVFVDSPAKHGQTDNGVYSPQWDLGVGPEMGEGVGSLEIERYPEDC